MRGLVVLFGILAASASANADNLLPLTSYRSQGDTDHCWAFALSHFLESRAASQTQVSVALDTERDLRYWVLHDRFFQRYKTKTELDGGLDDAGGILSEFGYPVEFLTAFLAHGHPTHSVTQVSGNPAYAFGSAYPTTIGFVGFDRPSGVQVNSSALIRTLGRTTSDAQAEQAIRKALDGSGDRLTAQETGWLGNEEIPVEQVSGRMLGKDLELLQSDELIWVQNDETKIHQYSPYYGGKYLVYYVSKNEFEALAKKSLDAGWPVLDTDFGHVWSVIGYRGETFVSADSAQDAISYGGLKTEVGMFVLKSFLATQAGDFELGLGMGNPRNRAFPTHNENVPLFR